MIEVTSDELRDRFETVMIVRNSKSDRRLHIPNGSGPLCESDSKRDWIEKDVAVYPKNWHSYCQRCLSRLEEQESEPGNAMYSTW